MASKKKPEVTLDPVSAEANTEFKVFDEPQGDMLGFAIATDTINGKTQRVAHVYLFEGRHELTLDKVTGKVSVEALERLACLYLLFGAKIKEFYAQRSVT